MSPLTQTIPVLDLRDFQDGSRREAFVTRLGSALEEIGFFALTHHGVDPLLIRQAYQVCQTFFALPDSVKLHYEIPDLKGQQGYTRFGREHAKDHPFPDLKEFWHLGRQSAITPLEVPDFIPTLLQLFQQLDACAAHLLEACSLYLGEEASQLPGMAQGGPSLLRVIHYPSIPLAAHPASVRAAAHEDINLITLLCEATADGLELQQRNGSWLPIRALPGQIIVDTGDMMQNLTNGLFRSTTHRVINPDNSRDQRFSMPFFVHPRPEVDLTPLPGCVFRTGGSQRFPSLSAGEFLHQRLTEIGLDPTPSNA